MSVLPTEKPRFRKGSSAAWQRLWAIFIKEFLQLKRDRGTMGMIVAIPLMQLTLFGYAINTDPKHLPTALLVHDDGPLARSVVSALRATDYFAIKRAATSEADADRMIRSNEVQFIIEIPPDFDRRLIHGEKPAVLLIADATDPTATVGAVAEPMARWRARWSGSSPARLQDLLKARRLSNCRSRPATIRPRKRAEISCLA